MATHSPVVLRELSGDQVVVLKPLTDKHEVKVAGSSDEIQGTLRLYPEAFLAASILVCEGASEVGLVRGIDQYRVGNCLQSLSALGVCLVDCFGGPADKPFTRASALGALGYRTAVLRDSDAEPNPRVERTYRTNEGTVFAWRKGLCLEDELFKSLPKQGIHSLLEYATTLRGVSLLDENIKSVSSGSDDWKSVQKEIATSADMSVTTRALLGRSSRTKSSGWFKNVRRMEYIGRVIVSPLLEQSDKEFSSVIQKVFTWMAK